MGFNLLWFTNSQVSDAANIFLNPVKIFAHKIFLLLMIVTQNQVFVGNLSDQIQSLSQGIHVQVNQSQVVL